MGDFHRSPSKVWWAEESHHWSLLSSSTSPGSQDSGFSDTEASPPAPPTGTPNNILKDSHHDATKDQNLSANFREKCTPRKTMPPHLSETPNRRNLSLEEGRNHDYEFAVYSEPIRRFRYQRNGSLKVNKKLFDATKEDVESNQYSTGDDARVESQSSSTSSKAVHDDSHFWNSDDSSSELPDGVKTYPFLIPHSSSVNQRNHSAPLILSQPFSNSITKEHTLSESDTESELEALFQNEEEPTCTSTPKPNVNPPQTMRHIRNKRISRLLKEHQKNRAKSNFKEEPPVVQKWLEEVKDLCEPECTTALQCKSIAGDLALKVAKISSTITASIRRVLCDADVIEREYENIESLEQYPGPLAQSFIGLVTEFMQNHLTEEDANLHRTCDKIRCTNGSNVIHLVVELFKQWKHLLQAILTAEVKKLVDYLEEPQSELHVRATLTGITSIALRREDLSSLFVAYGAVPNLCILCEKCEGSSVRSLILRGLSTLCNNGEAIRHFERADGIQIIADIVSDDSRPEPERSEAVALLAQVTAPWIEDNRTVRGLQPHLRVLVQALTEFIAKTKCCQNLLLCGAALANLSESDPESIKFILEYNSVANVLNAVKDRGSRISPYTLEQVAILLANVSSIKQACQMLIDENAPVFLLHFLMYSHTNEDVEKRLQQKSIIALSRLCSNKEAAQQVVDFDGVRRLVRLCRERSERHDSDAVLVAALATLRKISEACGTAVIDSQDALELVEPRLLDSFLAYSTQNESYV